jgi:hypothetical protein
MGGAWGHAPLAEEGGSDGDDHGGAPWYGSEGEKGERRPGGRGDEGAGRGTGII